MMEKYYKYLKTINEKLPKGWDKKSTEKLGKTIGKKPCEKGFFNLCVQRMEKHVGSDKVKGFCANIKDVACDSTYWRGKDKKWIHKKK